MKLTAMEGLYRGSCGQEIVAAGILNPDKRKPATTLPARICLTSAYPTDCPSSPPTTHSFVPGINDLIDWHQAYSGEATLSMHKLTLSALCAADPTHEALRMMRPRSPATKGGHGCGARRFKAHYPYSYGYLDSPEEASSAGGNDAHSTRFISW